MSVRHEPRNFPWLSFMADLHDTAQGRVIRSPGLLEQTFLLFQQCSGTLTKSRRFLIRASGYLRDVQIELFIQGVIEKTSYARQSDEEI